jgi:hypothetical protein
MVVPGGIARSSPPPPVHQNARDDVRLLDAGDHPKPSAAARAALDLDPECFADAPKVAFDEPLKELQEMRRQQASSIVIPDAGAAAAIGQAGLPPRGKIQIP